jgi:hypothetical protein
VGLRAAYLDGHVRTHDEQIAWVQHEAQLILTTEPQ